MVTLHELLCVNFGSQKKMASFCPFFFVYVLPSSLCIFICRVTLTIDICQNVVIRFAIYVQDLLTLQIRVHALIPIRLCMLHLLLVLIVIYASEFDYKIYNCSYQT